ncbi:fimbrial protein [Serratia proteamaculans]|uniref:fimbrial protein n=1 Tax=Serratia proteamaculans TaxID=28151 RepID=UPI0014323024|nr:fimbrial protein [Serratia proteamaculans]
MNIFRLTANTMIACGALWLATSPAQAALKCANGDGSATLVDLASAVKVTPSTPLGTTLFSQTFTGIKARCSLTTATGSGETAYFVRPNLSAALGGGLTLFVTYNGKRDSAAANISTGIIVTDRSAFLGLVPSFWQEVSLAPITIEIVKTAATGTAAPGSVSANLTIGSVGSTLQTSDKALYYLRGANTIGYVAETCKVPTPASFEVPLGNVATSTSSGFGSGVGSTSTAKDFAIALSCDTAVSGAFKVMMQLDGTPATGLATQGVLALKDAGGKGVAGGVGVQVLNRTTSSPVTFATPWLVGNFPMSSSLINVPFSARYYQTAASVTPGTANSSMTYTLSYQ